MLDRYPSIIGFALGIVLFGCRGENAQPGNDGGPATPSPDSGAGRADAVSPGGVGIDPSGGTGGEFPGTIVRDGYTLYVPTSYDPAEPMPLVSVFHGAGGNEANIVEYWRSTAEAEGFMVLAITSSGASGGWVLGPDGQRWLIHVDNAEGAYNIERAKHYLWGFSAGGHFVHWLVLQGTNADAVAGYAVHAGALDAAAGGGAPATASRAVPIAIRVGATDTLAAAARQDRERFLAAGWVEDDTLSYQEFAGGHVLPSGGAGDVWAFFAPWQRPPKQAPT